MVRVLLTVKLSSFSLKYIFKDDKEISSDHIILFVLKNWLPVLSQKHFEISIPDFYIIIILLILLSFLFRIDQLVQEMESFKKEQGQIVNSNEKVLII